MWEPVEVLWLVEEPEVLLPPLEVPELLLLRRSQWRKRRMRTWDSLCSTKIV
jgi:hypothetical protein